MECDDQALLTATVYATSIAAGFYVAPEGIAGAVAVGGHGRSHRVGQATGHLRQRFGGLHAVRPGGSPQALRYTLEDGVPRCEDIPHATAENVRPGDSRALGNVVITVKAVGEITPDSRQAAVGTATAEKYGNRGVPATGQSGAGIAQRAGAAAVGGGAQGVGPGEVMLMVRGRVLPLAKGEKFRAAQIPGLEPADGDGLVAEITANPKDPSILGLTNRSNSQWEVTTPEGKSHQVITGKTVRVSEGTKIRFGRTECTMQRQA